MEKDIRDNLSVLKADVEVFSGITVYDFILAFSVFFISIFIAGFERAIVLGGISLFVYQSAKKKLGGDEKVFEFIRYLGRPKKYIRRT